MTDTFYRDAKAMIDFHRLAKNLRAMKFDFSKGNEYGKKDKSAIIADDVPLDDADLVTSRFIQTTQWESDWHKVVLDIDYDAALIPSSTPGHHHLILDRALRWEEYQSLLFALAKVDVIQPGYAGASISKGYTAIRTPWEKK